MNNGILLSIIIPAYNAEKFINISLPSVLNERIFEEEIMDKYEIIFINDGSSDNTKKIAMNISKLWNMKTGKNSFMRVINKENGQYGSVINCGIKKARGHYFKVLDVDDHFNVKEFINLIYIINGLKKDIDVIFTDHIFEKVGSNKAILNTLKKNFNNCQLINLKKQKFPREIITMHSIIYRTNLLREHNYCQIEGVYYSDSQFSLIPLQYSKKNYYVDICLYGYYIGRDDQSINLKTMVKNSDHQLKVLNALLKDLDLDNIEYKSIYKYVILFIRWMIMWQCLLIVKDKTIKKKNKAILKLLQDLKKQYPKLMKKIYAALFFKYIIFFRGLFVNKFINFGRFLYSKFRKNILAEWD